MDNLIFDLQLFAPEGGGGEQPGGTEPGGGSSSSVSWSANTSITSGGTYNNPTYTSTNADENAVLISTTATVTLNDATVTKSGGTSASDNYSFYGINSAVMCMGGGTTSINGGTVTTDAAGANGIFSYGANNGTTNAAGDGTTVYVKDVTITTTGQGSGGIMTTYGGTTVAENLTITTDGGSSAPIRTDRGGGTVQVTGGTYTSNGLGSPAIYSTAAVTVNDAELISNQSEGVCIEGAGSIALSNCTLTANNSALNGNATFYDTIMIYQSSSGDASDGTSSFTMTGGTLNSQKGHVFHVTNTTAVINLDGVTINNSDSNNILLSVCDDGWSGNDNVVTFNASNQTLEGDILVGSDSTLTLNLEGSTFTGNVSGEISNASGTTVSTSIGTVNVTLDDNSKWYLTGDTYVTNFEGDAANVIANGFTLYENGVAVDGTTNSEEALNITNSTANSLITGTSLDDTISNSGEKVTIDGAAGNDYIENSGAQVSISGGAGNDSIYHSNSNSTIDAGAGNNIISISAGTQNVIMNGGGNDTLYFNDTLYGSNLTFGTISAAVSNTSVDGDNVILTTDNGSLTIVNAKNASLNLNGVTTVIGGDTSDDAICKIGGVTYASLQDAANAVNGGETITLTNNVTIEGYDSVTIDKEITFDLGTHTITSNSTTFRVETNATLNIKNGTIQSGGDGIYNQGTLNIDDVEISSIGISSTSVYNLGIATINDGKFNGILHGIFNNGTLIVNGGTITGEGNYADGINNYDGTVKISGGTITGNNVSVYNYSGTIEITGGTFNSDISEYVAANYSITQNDDGTYTVSAISGDTALNITNSENNTLITGTALNDTINNSGNNVTVDAGDGDNSVVNAYAANASISAGNGNDTITAIESANLYVNAGEGNNYVFNGYTYYDENNNLVDKETLAASTSSTILAGSGNDSIVNQGIYNASVDAGAGDNVISIYHSYTSSLITGSGDDLIDVARGGSLSVYTGEGNDSIIGHLATLQTTDYDNWAFGGGAVVDAGDGDDYISLHYSDNSTIYGGAGNDTIINNGANTTINGGDGDDYIELTNNLREETGDYEPQVIVASAGNDTITGVTSNTTIQGTFTASTVDGSNVILTTDDGNLTILDGAGQTLNINGTESVIAGNNDTIGAAVAEFILKRTEKGYPALCDIGLFEPDTVGFPAPEGYLTENWTIESADNLKLSGTHYTPKNPKGQWVVLVTGYGQVGATMNIHAAVLLSMDYDILVVEPRASGNSEGDWLTMGVAECVDVALWTQKIAETNANAQITLFGISMGAATVMMAAALSQTTNVTSLVEDCGYANVYSIFENLAPHFVDSFGWTGTTEELFDKVADATETLTGYNVADAVPLDSIGQVTVPSLFIHGTADTLVPVENVQKLYDASGAITKEMWTVEGGVHGKSVLEDPFTYLEKADTLIESANKEIGASITSSDSDSVIRGTIYDDTIFAYGDNVTVDALTGNDHIYIAADNVSVNTGDGNNIISAFESAQLQITTGDGDNSIENIYIKYDETKETFVNYDSTTSSTIITGNGNDTISNQGVYKGVVNAGEGDNYVELDHSYENTVTTGAGNDSLIVERGSSVTAYTGDGDDSIIGQQSTVTSASNWTFGAGATIDAGAGNDYISPSYTNNSSIFGGAGNDSIINNGANTTINGGDGDDYIELTDSDTGNYENAVIVASAGNDTIKNYSDVVSLQGTFTSTEMNGSDIILTTADGNLTIIDGVGKVLNLNDESSVILTDANSSATLNGKTFTLVEAAPNGVKISEIENGFEISHAITAAEVERFKNAGLFYLSESDIGKTMTETVTITGDDSYSFLIGSTGIDTIREISDGAQIKAKVTIDGKTFEEGTTWNLRTDSEGTFIFDDKSYNTQNDASVIFFGKFAGNETFTLRKIGRLPEGAVVSGNFNGEVSVVSADTTDRVISISAGADNASILAGADNFTVKGVTDGASITADDTVVEVKNSMTVNEITYKVNGDADGVLVAENEITGLDADASLTVSEAGNYSVNNTALEVSESDTVIAVDKNYAYISGSSNPVFKTNETTEQILNALGVAESDAKIVPATATDEQQVSLDNDGDIAIIEATDEPVTVISGKGDDTIVTKGDNVTVDMSKGGADKIIPLGGTVKLENYNPDKTDAGIKYSVNDYKDGMYFENGALILSNATVVPDGNILNTYDLNNKKEKLGFAKEDNKVVDLSSSTEDVLLAAGSGYYKDDGISNSTLKGGKGNDKIYGGEKSQIKPGAGNDTVEMSSLGGSTVNYTSGNDSISGLNFAGGSVAADTLTTGALTINGVETSNGAVILQTNNGDIQIAGAENKNIAFDNHYTDEAITMQAGDDLNYDGVANLFWATGENAIVSVGAGVDSTTALDLDLTRQKFNATTKPSFYGDIKEVDAGSYAGAASITGNDKDNVITASEGGSTINGGGGNNSLKGGSGTDEFISSSGKNTIANFEFGEDKDTLNLGSQAVSGVKASGNDITLKYKDGSAKVEGASGKIMQLQNKHTNNTPILAQFADDSLTVDDTANFYWAGGKNAVVIVGKNMDSTTALTADLSNADFNNAAQKSFNGDIKELDASGFAGASELKGNSKHNIITASEGGSTLNGGGGNNSLKGGKGADEFISESGKNTIANFEFYAGNNADTADMINLGAQAIKGVNVSGDDVILKYDGGLAKIEGAAGQTIQLQNEHTGETPILAQFAKDSLSINDTAKFYWASGKNATVSVTNYSANTVTVDLNNADFNNSEQLSFYGNIREVDASGYKQYAIIDGNDKNNVLKAGRGGSELWGGNGGNDTLIGGNGNDVFIYRKDNGNDVIQNMGSGDVISFGGLTLDDISNIECTDSSIKFKFGGGSLKVETDDAESVQFVVDSQPVNIYTYNKTTGSIDAHVVPSGNY